MQDEESNQSSRSENMVAAPRERLLRALNREPHSPGDRSCQQQHEQQPLDQPEQSAALGGRDAAAQQPAGITSDGAELMTPQSESIEDPFKGVI